VSQGLFAAASDLLPRIAVDNRMAQASAATEVPDLKISFDREILSVDLAGYTTGTHQDRKPPTSTRPDKRMKPSKSGSTDASVGVMIVAG
jgi:hypothetical protein